jgi:hypothetical protein
VDLSPIVERLRERVAWPVAGAAQLAAVQSVPQPLMGWVLPLAERAEANQTIGGVYQRLTVRLAVVLYVRQVADARGEAALEALEPAREAILSALVGWAPAAEHAPLELRNGRLLTLADGALWWQDEFETTFSRRFTPA